MPASSHVWCAGFFVRVDEPCLFSIMGRIVRLVTGLKVARAAVYVKCVIR